MKEDTIGFLAVCLVLPFFILDVRATYTKSLRQIKIGGGLVGIGAALLSLLRITSKASVEIAEFLSWSIICIGFVVLLRAFIVSWRISSREKRKPKDTQFEPTPLLNKEECLSMKYTQEQEFDCISEFSKQRKKQAIATALYVGICFTTFVLVDHRTAFFLGLLPIIWVPIFLLVVGGMIFFSLKNWRCPACGTNLKNGFSPSKCPCCGIQFFGKVEETGSHI